MSDIDFDVCVSGDVTQIMRYLASELDNQSKENLVHSLKYRLLDASRGSMEEQLSWLKTLFCESPMIDSDLSADELIRLFTFLLTKLYTNTQSFF